jgi:hypothetical protein
MPRFGLPCAVRATLGGVALLLGSQPVLAAHAVGNTPDGTAIADSDAKAERPPERDPRQYALAAGAGLSLGDGGWGTELSSSQFVYARYQVYRGLGLGASYSWLTASNNEGNSWPTFHAQALEGFAELHPFLTSWVDPFVRAGVLGLTEVEGIEEATRFGAEFTAGLNATLPSFAIGVHVRYGFTNQAWTMAGIHTEVRF